MAKARILHTMLRVGNLQRSVAFYTAVLNMRVLRTHDQPEDGFTLVFLGYSDEKNGCALELTYNYGVDQYDPGNAYGHIAIGVEDCKQACATVAQRGGQVTMAPKLMAGLNETIAFIRDPDGYKIELVERPVDWF